MQGDRICYSPLLCSSNHVFAYTSASNAHHRDTQPDSRHSQSVVDANSTQPFVPTCLLVKPPHCRRDSGTILMWHPMGAYYVTEYIFVFARYYCILASIDMHVSIY